MIKLIIKIQYALIFTLFLFSSNLKAATFTENIREIRSEINRDNLQGAIKKLKKIKISKSIEQEQIDLLFGDIYLKINQPEKAEEFYQKSFFTNQSRSRSYDIYRTC